MKADKFYSFVLIDKFSRVFMLMFSGIILGLVLAFAFHNIFRPEISKTLIFIVLYCLFYITYVLFTDTKRKSSKIEIFKDHISVVLQENNKISNRYDVSYDEISEYKISPLSDKKNQMKEEINKEKLSLRVFGYKTEIKTKDGSNLEFKSSPKDGVLVYSPFYVYRMIDLKRNVQDFPLVLENFDIKSDPEDFDYQFRCYSENQKNLSILENKKYLKYLFKYASIFGIIMLIVALIIGSFVYIDTKNQTVLMFFISTLLIFAFAVLPIFLVAFLSSFLGNIVNKKAEEEIAHVIKG